MSLAVYYETTSEDVAEAVENWIMFGDSISNSVARVIASYWQSSGSIGSVLAAYASGASVSKSSIKSDILATIKDCGNNADTIELKALLAFIG